MNLRGGGEFGEGGTRMACWHASRMSLMTVAALNIWSRPSQSDALVAMGGSNGGLLAGVAAVQQYDPGPGYFDGALVGHGALSPVPDGHSDSRIRGPGSKEDLIWILPYSHTTTW